MEVMILACTVQDRMLNSTEKFDNVLLIHAQCSLSHFVKRFFVSRFLIELFPSTAKHDLGSLGKLKRKASFFQDTKQEKSI